jgi:hypothetical protein
MFTTLQRNALAPSTGEVTVWGAVEIQHGSCWFIFYEPPLPSRGTRCFLIRHPHDVVALAAQSASPPQVTMATPPHINDSSAWRFEALGEIWLCEEPDAGANAWIATTEEGCSYVISAVGTPQQALRRIDRIFVSRRVGAGASNLSQKAHYDQQNHRA